MFNVCLSPCKRRNANQMYLVQFLPQVQDRRQLGGPLFLVKLARFKIGSHQNFELANHLKNRQDNDQYIKLRNKSSSSTKGNHDLDCVWISDFN